MKLKALCALIILTAATQAHAKWFFGGHDGNGGGGFCNQGVCKTAAEAGIQIKGDSQNPSYWILPGDVIQQVEGIISALPFGQTYLKTKTFATPSTFVVAESFNWNAMRRIKNDYKEVMAKNNFAKPSGELEIFAISDSRYTYLLPSFFKLNSRQKALILIHEGNIRAGLSLAKTLEFDSLLLNYLQDRQGNNFDYPRFLGSLQDIVSPRGRDLNDDAKVFAALVDHITTKSGRNLSLANFRDDGYDNLSFYPDSLAEVGRLAVAKSASVFGPRFSKMFGAAQMSLFLSHGDYYKYDATSICKGLESKPGFQKWPLVLVESKSVVAAVNCGLKYKDGYYGALKLVINYIDFGNIKE
ncbi:MAG: hypothetical protein J7501_02480 [Bdellovibrio sp.]|nr:hypothetical protein [Bdellovibrio sp.]